MTLFRSFLGTVAPFVRGLRVGEHHLLEDPITGAPTGIQSKRANGPHGIWTPIDLTAAQIASPTADMIADLNAVFRLNVAPYTRYQSNGTSLGLLGTGGTLSQLATNAAAAANSNPRLNAVMASPPTITAASLRANSTAYTLGQKIVTVTGTTGFFYTCATAGTTASSGGPTGTGNGQTDGTAVWNFFAQVDTNLFWNNAASHSYLWNQGAGPLPNVANLYGGEPFTNVGSASLQLLATTVAGTKTGGVTRINFVTDSAKFVMRVIDANATNALYRLIVNGQFASLTASQPPTGGWNYILVDFTSAGGAVSRNITLEFQTNTTQFASIDVAVTEGVYNPGGPVALKAMLTGDSYGAAAGVANPNDGFGTIMADYLGIPNMANMSIGGTGLLATSSSGTAISRVNDIFTFAPDILFVEQGRNDTTFTPAQVTAAMLAYLRAIRANAGTASIPIFVFGIMAGPMGAAWAAGIATETALLAAVTAIADPMIFFIPVINDPGGSWMTGTGDDVVPAGDGNSDRYISHVNTPHPNLAGNIFLAGRMSDAVRRILASLKR